MSMDDTSLGENNDGVGDTPEADVPETEHTEPGGQDETHDYSSAEDQSAHRSESGPNGVEALQTENAALKDRLLRAVAEAENVRRRAEKDKIDASKFGISRFARDLMSVADNFQRALESITDEVRAEAGELTTNLILGVEMTEKELLSAFEKNGVRPVRPQSGEKFDPNIHQAIAEIPTTDQPGGTVMHVTQVGYALEDRLLRPAMVTVAKGAPPGQAPSSNETKTQNGDKPSDPGSTVNTTA